MSRTQEGQQGIADQPELRAREELKRGYMQVSFGQFDQAIDSCRRAAEFLPEHHLPATLHGSFELAAGRVRDALGTLRKAVKRHPNEPLPQVYFAEACFIAGRFRQGERALARAEQLDADGACAELISQLSETWSSVDAADVPPPLVAKLDAGDGD